uniref:Uncharacterized protein n=1 Tax=Amphimedon queenslandica TaxID=400682 RepID=A0A1X7SQJ4_AMPQE
MADYCDRSNELVPGEDIPYHQMGTDPISSGEEMAVLLDYLQENTDPKSSDENQQEMTRTQMSKVRKRYRKVSDMEQPLLDQPPEQPPEDNESTEKAKQDFLDEIHPGVSDINEIQEEQPSTNQKIETSEERLDHEKNETKNEKLEPNSNDGETTRMDITSEEKEETPSVSEINADRSSVQRGLVKKKDKSDPTYYLPDESYYNSFGYNCCSSCKCKCPTCFECAVMCCSFCDRCDPLRLPDSENIRIARWIGFIIITAAIFENLYNRFNIIKTRFNKCKQFIREIFAYAGLIAALFAVIFGIIKIALSTQGNHRQLEKTLNYISFGFSMFGLPFSIIDAIIRFRHHGCRVCTRIKNKKELVQDGDEDKAAFCDDKCPRCEGTCGKSCVIVMDVARIFVLEIIFYPNFLVDMFQFIRVLVDNNYDLKMVKVLTWLGAVKSLFSILVLVYLQKGYVFFGIIYSVRKVRKEQK